MLRYGVGFENYAYLMESTAFINSMKATGLFVLYTVPIGIHLSAYFSLYWRMKN